MGQSIQSGVGSDAFGSGCGEYRIDDRHVWDQLRALQQHFYVSCGVGDHGEHSGFGSGAGGGGDCHHGDEGTVDHFAHKLPQLSVRVLEENGNCLH